jgi:hypothetical protein
MVCRLIFQMRPLYYRDRLLNSDVHLVCRQVLHPELHLVHPHRRIRRQHLLVADHQNHLGDLHLGEVRQSHRDDLRLDDQRRLDVDRRIHLGDLNLGDLHQDDPVRLDVRQLDEVRQLLRHPDVVRHCQKKMDYCPHVVAAAQK